MKITKSILIGFVTITSLLSSVKSQASEITHWRLGIGFGASNNQLVLEEKYSHLSNDKYAEVEVSTPPQSCFSSPGITGLSGYSSDELDGYNHVLKIIAVVAKFNRKITVTCDAEEFTPNVVFEGKSHNGEWLVLDKPYDSMLQKTALEWAELTFKSDETFNVESLPTNNGYKLKLKNNNHVYTLIIDKGRIIVAIASDHSLDQTKLIEFAQKNRKIESTILKNPKNAAYATAFFLGKYNQVPFFEKMRDSHLTAMELHAKELDFSMERLESVLRRKYGS